MSLEIVDMILNAAFCVGVAKGVVAFLVISDRVSEGQTVVQATKSTFHDAIQLYKDAGQAVSKTAKKLKNDKPD